MHRLRHQVTEISNAINTKALLPIVLLLASWFQLIRIEADETHYFQVGFRLNGKLEGTSYVLPLSKPEDISHARYLISLGPAVWNSPEPAKPVVVARIVYEKDAINRDYTSPTFREWSWHVVEFLAFADLTAEILDGSPLSVEEGDFAGGETIGFWSYTVVRELGQVPLYLSVVPGELDLQLYWSGLGTNYVYSLESKQLTGTDWAPLPSVPWPLATIRGTLIRHGPDIFVSQHVQLTGILIMPP